MHIYIILYTIYICLSSSPKKSATFIIIIQQGLTQNAECDAGEDEDGAERDGPARVPQAGVRHFS